MNEVTFALTVIVLFLKGFTLAGIQGINRLKSGVMVRPEDAACFAKQAPAAQELKIVERAQNAIRNDLENVPYFLFLMLAYLVLHGPVLPLQIYAAIFVLSRIGHSYFYIYPRQPHRNRVYLMGMLMSMILSGHLLWLCFLG